MTGEDVLVSIIILEVLETLHVACAQVLDFLEELLMTTIKKIFADPSAAPHLSGMPKNMMSVSLDPYSNGGHFPVMPHSGGAEEVHNHSSNRIS